MHVTYINLTFTSHSIYTCYIYIMHTAQTCKHAYATPARRRLTSLYTSSQKRARWRHTLLYTSSQKGARWRHTLLYTSSQKGARMTSHLVYTRHHWYTPLWTALWRWRHTSSIHVITATHLCELSDAAVVHPHESAKLKRMRVRLTDGRARRRRAHMSKEHLCCVQKWKKGS